MFELGENETALHEEIGRYACDRTDVLLCVGKLAKSIYEAAIAEQKSMDKGAAGQFHAYYYATRDELETELPKVLQNDDTILVKASHGMALGHVVELLTKA